VERPKQIVEEMVPIAFTYSAMPLALNVFTSRTPIGNT
jgi:hypothetical protein